MTHPLLVTLAALVLTLAPHVTRAQRRTGDTAAARAAPDTVPAGRDATRRPYWVNVGLAGNDESLGLGVSFTRARRADRIVTVRGLLTQEFCILGCDGLADWTGEVGVLYGVAAQSRFAVLSVAAGGAAVGLRRSIPTGASAGPYYRESTALTVGIPFEGQLFVRPFRFLGLGVAGMVNVNPEHSFAGLLVGLQLGRLTTRWERPPATSPGPH